MPGRARMRILVVEDEWMLALSLSDALRKLGCDVVGPAGHLSDAMALGRSEAIDAAILDLNLHGELTYPVAKALRERGLPFIFLTGYVVDAVPSEFRSVPILEKPFTDGELTLQVQRLAGERGVGAIPHGTVGT
jgi:DNA-binding response OmpR family regulator